MCHNTEISEIPNKVLIYLYMFSVINLKFRMGYNNGIGLMPKGIFFIFIPERSFSFKNINFNVITKGHQILAMGDMNLCLITYVKFSEDLRCTFQITRMIPNTEHFIVYVHIYIYI